MSNRAARRALEKLGVPPDLVPLAADAKTLQKLTEFHNDWQQSTMRLQMAEQTVAGARADALAKEARFKGAVEFFGGAKVTYNFHPEAGVTLNMPVGDGPAPPNGTPANGAPAKRKR